ncbi:MAG: hypothetical protein HQL04_01345 [Nitrospirae bacterium]|nr:hypothetical protein [Nitrospirota bacterium]
MRRHRTSNTVLTTILIVSCLLPFTMLPVFAWQKFPLQTMGGAGDIIIQSPSDNQTVVYDQATGTWVNAALSGVARDSLSCYATGLTYDHTTGIFSFLPGYSIPTTANQTLWTGHLSDLNNPHATTLTQLGIGSWSGSNNITTVGAITSGTVPWANVSKAGSALGDIVDTNIATPVDGQVIRWDASTSKWIKQPSLIVGKNDQFNRPQISFHGWNTINSIGSVLKLGQMQPDGDPANIISEGIVVHGSPTGSSTDMKSIAMGDAYNRYGYARIKPNRFALWGVDSVTGLNGDYFRVDNNNLFLKSDSNTTTFNVARATGIITAATWQGVSIGDSYISSAATWNAKQNALTAGVDYLTPTGNGSSLTGLTGSQISGNISGNAGNVTGTVAIGNGGTGQTTAQNAINALTNVSGATNGYVLTKVGTDATWAASAGGGSSTLATLTDVTLTYPTDGQVLKYDNASSKWINAAAPSSYTDANARAAMSNTATGLTYSNATGITSLTSGYVIPTTTQESTWNAKQNALTAGVDYLTPTGNGSGLTGITGGQISGNISGNAANVTGTVAIANGGTGSTTASAAFNALRPTTAKGDIVSDNGTATAILATGGAGTNTYVLTRDDSTATGLKWAAPGAVTLSASNVDGLTTELNGSAISVSPWITADIMLLAFYREVDKGIAYGQMADGIIDRFYDQTGIATGSISNFTYTGASSYNYAVTPGTGWSQTSSAAALFNMTGVSGSTTSRAGYCFIATTTGTAESIKFKLRRFGAAPSDLLVYMYSSYTGTVAANTAVPSGSGTLVYTLSSEDRAAITTDSAGAIYTYTLSTPFSLTSGNTYCVEIKTTQSQSGTDYIHIYGANSDVTAQAVDFYYNSSYGSAVTQDMYGVITLSYPASAVLPSIAFTALSAPTVAQLTLFETDGSPAPPTTMTGATDDIQGWVSADNGSTFTQIPLVNMGYYGQAGSTSKILSGTATITSGSGTSMKWKVVMNNSKRFTINGVGLTWQ